MNTERSRRWRSALTMPALFIASYSVTYWITRPTLEATPLRGVEARTAASGVRTDTPMAEIQAAPLTDAGWTAEEPTPAPPAPSLQELATDTDAQIREEAQALLGLLDQEQFQ